MPSLQDARNANAAFNPSYVPTAIITGATAGIGQAIAEALARYLKGRIHLIIVGRNRAAAESIIASLPKASPSPNSVSEPELEPECTYEFVQCDMAVIKNVRSMAKDFSGRLSRVNFLVHCAAIVGFGGRKEADPTEGLDEKMATLYYARWRLTYDLLPLLRKAKEEGQEASVLSVYGAGLAKEVDIDDLGLKKTYTGRKAMAQSNGFNDLMIAEFASREPEIAFTHIHPGAVYTGTMINKSIITRILIIPLFPLIWLVTTPKADCAEYMLYALLSAKKGMNRRNWRADDIGMKKFPMKEGAQKALWDHTVEVTSFDV